MAEDTAALLEQLDVKSVDVVGWSDGGVIGYLLAIHHPQLVRKLVTSGANVDGEGVPPPKTGEIKPEQLPKMFEEEYDKVSPDGPQHYAAFINRVVSMWMIAPGTGHGTFRERPQLVDLAVLEFLDAPEK
jgi:pimeloyl-ACP methyl ester carboxylesterase